MERNVTLDFVRGVAILGILLLNITAFGLPFSYTKQTQPTIP